MNAIAKIDRSPVEAYVDEVLPADRLADLSRSLPSHIRPELFKRNLLNVVMINWELMKCEAGLLFREVSKAAGLGLFLDPALGEAYIVMAYNYKTKQQEPQLRIGYRGLTKLARQSGSVSLVYAHEVRANDHIVCRLGTEKQLVHEPKLFTERGDIIGYYAVITYNDQAFDFEPMSVAEIHGIRDRSDAWKAYSEKKIKSTPWSTDESEMAKKTVIRRLMKRAPQSPELVEALRIEDSAEGYISDRTVVPKRVAPVPPTLSLVTPPEFPAEATTLGQDLAKRTAPKPAEKASTKDLCVDAPEDFAAILALYEAEAKTITTDDDLNALWDRLVEPGYDNFMADQQEEILQKHRHRTAELEP